ncbi:ATP-dependent DNA helicase RecG [Candidatus Microgenomates bacterium]|nr:ATP-dependent DNA helicase RecG [Candidatus Microgenomates bacterium]
MLALSDSVSQVPLVGPACARRLEKLGIKTVRDLLYHVPFRYDDYATVSKIKDLQDGETVTIQAKVLTIKNIFTRRGFVLQKATVQDDTGTLDVLWFNQRFLTSAIHPGDTVNLSGKIEKHQLKAPDYEIVHGETIHTGRLVPVYPETAGLSSKWLRSRINTVLKQVKVIEFLPETTMMGESEAITKVHFPDDLEQAAAARERLAFDELLISQLKSQTRKAEQQQRVVGNKFKIVENRDSLTKLVASLPFTLTRAQRKVIDEIYQDLAKPTPMNRLLQGDVGSGKTVVAALAMLAAYLNGYQSVLMAPTEILANQHYETLQQLLAPLKIGVGLATGSRKNYAAYDVIVGTHALINIDLKKLGLVVIDESHRFGVEQKALLAAKGLNPHVLTMTATPIPRTVALTLYGDLDISILDEMPLGRKVVKTWVIPETKRASAYQWIQSQKTPAFIICPLIEESETLVTVKSAKAEFAHLQKEVFPKLKLGLIHGRLKPVEKDAALKKFKAGKTDILVATPVVEVGIDIPQASIIVIEAADRFGLAQLHQLRGRVGRSGQQAYCFLFSENPAGTLRLKHLESVTDGLKLAEIDLKFRGPGERFGLSQHGKWDLKIASFSDLDLVERSNALTQKILANPTAFPLLLDMIKQSKIKVVQN